MGNPPFRPSREIEHALEHGDLRMAIAIAKDFAGEQQRPIPLNLALKMLPLVSATQQDSYDTWACR